MVSIPKIDSDKYHQKKWSRKLYMRHPYPDNYVDDTFLTLKRINVNARIYSYWPTVFYSGLIVQQLSSVIIFVLIYVYLRMNLIKVESLMIFYVIPVSLLAYTGKIICTEFTISKDLVNFLKFLSFTYGLSPILNSLTESISSDTIYATSTLMLFLNLIFHDYDSSEAAIASKTFSFNAALFACVCLGSRFSTSSFHSFSLITIAFILFALLPEYRQYLQINKPKSIVCLTFLNFIICLSMLVNLELWSFTFYYILVCTIISFVCPAILVKLQVYKKTIHGPWDEALIRT